MDWKNWTKFINRETILYVVFGVLTTVVDWAVYVAAEWFQAGYERATVLAWAAAVLFAFITNKILVFRSREHAIKAIGREFVSFVGCRLFTLLVSYVGMKGLVGGLHWNEYIGKALLSILVLLLNYVFSKVWIFRSQSVRKE